MKNKTNVFSIVLFFSAFIMTILFGGQKAEWKGKIELENGVKVVRNPKMPIYAEDVFNLEEELSIGGAEGREEYIFSYITDVGVDEEESIYILDSKKSHIKVFDRMGEYIKTIGKKGQGPGEMRRPTSLQVTSQNEIVVNDSAARKLHFFTLDGNFLRAVSQTKMTFFSNPKVDNEGNIIASYMIADLKVTYVLKKFNPQLEEIFTIFSTEVLKYPYINPFFPQCYWEITTENNLIWGFADKYELHIINSEGKLIKKIIKEYDPIKITEEEKENEIKERFGGYEGMPPGTKLSWKKHHNAFIYLSIDDKGRIFIRTYERISERDEYYYDVFDSEGKYIAKVALRVRPQTWKNGKLYAIEEDEDGYQFVKRYKVTWKY
ncbi:MAG: 6-bladed beta-propeller [Candidatus Aminicenantaceae bacterium]